MSSGNFDVVEDFFNGLYLVRIPYLLAVEICLSVRQQFKFAGLVFDCPLAVRHIAVETNLAERNPCALLPRGIVLLRIWIEVERIVEVESVQNNLACLVQFHLDIDSSVTTLQTESFQWIDLTHCPFSPTVIRLFIETKRPM